MDDVELLQHALQSGAVDFTMHTIYDGGKAVDYIRTGADSHDIVILDFNLPKVHGKDIMLELKATDRFRHVPLLILTTSSAQNDKDFAYANGADKYLVKPTEIEKIKELVAAIVSLAGEKYKKD